MEHLPLHQRQQVMEEQADRVEETTYFKPLTPEELDLKRERLTDNAIKLSEIEDEKKETMKEFKDRTDPLVLENRMIMMDVKRKSQEVQGRIYHIANYDDGTMETYDYNGEFISSRRLRPDEKQKNIFSLKQAQ